MQQITKLDYMDQEFYTRIKEILLEARHKVYQTANFEMVLAYWKIGKSIVEKQKGNERAGYGEGLIKELLKQMTKDFGKGYTERNLRAFRQFYIAYPNWYAVRAELSWTHRMYSIELEYKTARKTNQFILL